tara:strand:- start:1172 stop:2551 length:1380 start_codon:yes stop_codon:yes gene_type:complete
MFDKEFYPTPENVLESMGIDCINKVVLDPSAGSGNILDYVLKNNAKSVFAYEKNKDLQKIVQTKSKVLGSDFFEAKSEDVSHIDLIVMNPPFSNADKHILHAFEIAPEGCEINALCNYQTISNDYNRYRTQLKSLIQKYGISHNMGDCFTDAERATGIDIGLIKLYKPCISKESSFDGFFMDDDEEEMQGNGIMPFNEVRALVQRYVGAVKGFDRLKEVTNELEYTLKPLRVSNIEIKLSYNDSFSNREDFAKEIQKRSWAHIFSKMNLNKFVTSGVMEDINKFVEQQQSIPFTMKNVYRMFEIIVGTRQQTMDKALEEVVDNFTMHTKENRFGVEGWKTNSGYMLNEKFIINNVVEPKWNDSNLLEIKSYRNDSRLNDLTKVLCNITGQNYNEIKGIMSFERDLGGIERSKWYTWGFFEFKCFKKGTMHLRFKDKDVWYRLNKAYGELKGFTLSESYR